MDKIKKQFIDGQYYLDKDNEKVFYQFYKNPELLKIRLHNIYKHYYWWGFKDRCNHLKSYMNFENTYDDFFIDLLKNTANGIFNFEESILYIRMITENLENELKKASYICGYYHNKSNIEALTLENEVLERFELILK